MILLPQNHIFSAKNIDFRKITLTISNEPLTLGKKRLTFGKELWFWKKNLSFQQ